MPSTDPHVDAYIKKSAPFAQPILEHLRQLVHKACPQVTETIKWGFPHFEYKGLLCSMAAFRQHCNFGFWKGSLLKDDAGVLEKVGKTDMGFFDKINTLEDLPSDKVIITYIREAMRLNDENVRVPSKPRSAAALKSPETPPDLAAALKKNKAAQQTFEGLSPSGKKEYITWINDAKTEDTRAKRLATTIEWLSEGKTRNWKYEKK
ncbi:MAG TPA: YdeI/OmpD-associated family protein [Chitinophagaceae bacterium]|nr:YdeI/OmpD-associated family protein [Chitinophagaceae bacterium]